MTNENKSEMSFVEKVRLNFFYGLVVVLPVFATVWLVLFIIEWITGPASTLIGPGMPQLFSFVVTIIFIILVGLIAKNYVGKIILNFVESVFVKIPIIGAIYTSSKQIISAFSLKDTKNLVPVLVEYPRKDLWALGFITQENVAGINLQDGSEFGNNQLAVFIPTTPNPTSGYFVYSDKDAIKRLDMSVEQSIKLLMSAGVINPSSRL